ncbi:MAG: MarR family winged helix-turn-helix transcriptional regulator [Magnetospiraceae bacterium]
MQKPTEKTTGREAEPISESHLDDLIGYHIRRASNIIQADLARTLKPFDLRMLTLSALAVIAGNPGLRQSQLADALEIERPNLVVVVDELERRELILRERTPTDRRAYALTPTLAGRTLLNKALKAVQDHERRLFAGIPDDLKTDIINVMTKIRNNG